MVKWFVDQKSKIPMYLQLKDQIEYYISTGSILPDHKLPPVKALAKQLGINFDTVRKAYKELERDGLVTMRRSEGTFVSLHRKATIKKTIMRRPDYQRESPPKTQFASELKKLVQDYLAGGSNLDETRQLISQTLDELERPNDDPIVIFTECNQFQIKQISEQLSESLKLNVKPILIADLENEVPALIQRDRPVHVVTTGFHVNEVSRAVGQLSVNTEVLITNLEPETRRQLESAGEKAKYGFICRDEESALIYRDLLKAELGFDEMHLDSCTLAEQERVEAILNSADLVLASPPVYEEVKKLAPPQRRVFNLFERVDPMSLRVVRDRILNHST